MQAARTLLKAEEKNPAFSRPADYFAEMVKSDEHMGRIKEKMMDEASRQKAAAEARKQRDLKKFGKQVQVAKLQERDRAKRETLGRIEMLKRSEYCDHYYFWAVSYSLSPLPLFSAFSFPVSIIQTTSFFLGGQRRL